MRDQTAGILCRKKILFFSISLGMLSFAVPTAHTDILTLKSGDTLEGKVTEDKDEGILFEIDGGVVAFQRAEIEKIEDKPYFPAFQKMTQGRERGKGLSMEVIWQKGASLFSRKNKSFPSSYRKPVKRQTNSDPAENSNGRNFTLILLTALVQVLVASGVMQLYFLISRTHVTYFQSLLFQIKLMLVGSSVGLLGVTGVALGYALTMGPEAEPPGPWITWLMGLGCFMIFYSITYYVLAKKDFDAGFSEAFILGSVIGVTYFVVAQGFQLCGLGYTDPMVRQIEAWLRAVGL